MSEKQSHSDFEHLLNVRCFAESGPRNSFLTYCNSACLFYFDLVY
jgi:hypothetical protein